MLNVEAVNVSYGDSRVIHDLSFLVRPQESVAILGRNGMGKTTLLKALMGIIPTRSGRVSMQDEDITHKESYERVAKGLAFVPQGRMIFPQLTVEENIQTGCETSSSTTIGEEVYSLFPVLFEMRRRKGGNLSGGQQQQLAIARALVSNPKVILLDEPTEGIQPSIIKDIAKVLGEVKRTMQIAFVVSEQMLSFALDIADRILIIEKGAVVHEEERQRVDIDKVKQYLTV
ncbi:MAG: urea ABC transporter ATP-binding subunit UrtE [Deltaproteobacteria bacterium]|nr:urea ABC transporter ATP-binding subunit UrtE [Deltaproteobacteria bacterium]